MSEGLELNKLFGGGEIDTGRMRQSPAAMEPVRIAADVIAIIGASVIAGTLYHKFAYGTLGEPRAMAGLGVVAAMFHVFVANSLGLYRLAPAASLDRQWKVLTMAWGVAILLTSLVLFLLQLGTAYSRGATVLFAVAGLAGLVVTRALIAMQLREVMASGALTGRCAVVLGAPDELNALRRNDLPRRFGVSEVARIALPKAAKESLRLDPAEVAAIDSAIEAARGRGAHEMVLALPWDDVRRIDLVRDRLRSSPLPVRLVPDRRVSRLLQQPILADGPAISFELQRGPLSVAEQLHKRFFDIALASVALVLLSPLLALTAIAIKLDSSGPVLFRQRRNGFNGRPFLILKFRTMNVLEDGTRIEQARRGDSRVTAVGRILRRTSIDELPQLINVLRGDMSLIGPRPHALAHDDQYSNLIATYAFRHHVKPGITGWAQVCGCRGETARLEQMRARVELDLWYINNWSPLLDVKILLRTCMAVTQGEAAY